jgi:hypothetical protein
MAVGNDIEWLARNRRFGFRAVAQALEQQAKGLERERRDLGVSNSWNDVLH